MRIRDFIVCDDIRQEVGNKHTIVGIFDDAIVFNVLKDNLNNWPKTSRLGFYIRINFDDGDPAFDSVALFVQFDEMEEIRFGSIIKTDGHDARKMHLVMQHGRFSFPKASKMRFFVRFYEGEDTVCELPIEDEIILSEVRVDGPAIANATRIPGLSWG